MCLQEEKRTLLETGSLLEEAPPKQRNLRALGRKRFRKNRGCSYGTDFKTGNSIHLGLGGCAGICIESRNGETTQEICNSNDDNQRYTIRKASGGEIGFYVIADGGECLQPESCDLTLGFGGSSSDVIVASCGYDKARWAPAGGGMLFSVGCFESANVADAVGALGDGECGTGTTVRVDIDAIMPEQVVLFMSDCAVRTVNSFS
jgi:hypothetical protein